MQTHQIELLVVDGGKKADCEWRHVENKRWDVIDRVIEEAGSPFTTYKVLIERENGWLSLAKENRDYYYEVLEQNEIDLNTYAERWANRDERN